MQAIRKIKQPHVVGVGKRTLSGIQIEEISLRNGELVDCIDVHITPVYITEEKRLLLWCVWIRARSTRHYRM
jgi:hypothetical protein